MSVKKGEIYEGWITDVLFPNKGITEVEGRQVIVKNAAKGQKVRFQVNKVRKGKCEARLLEVAEKAPDEIEPACPHFGLCGGCTWQNLPYEKQLEMKEAQVRKLLAGLVDEEVFEGIKASPKQAEYRNKMEFSFGDEIKDGPLALGMHKRGSFYDIVTVNQNARSWMKISVRILTAVLEFCQEQIHGHSYHHRLRHDRLPAPPACVRKAVKTGEILVDLVTTSGGMAWMIHPVCLGRIYAEVFQPGAERNACRNSSYHQRQPGRCGTKMTGTRYFMGTGLSSTRSCLGLTFSRSHHFPFFQTNSLGAEVLYETARTYVGETKDKVLFDLYSGTGTIAQILSASGGQSGRCGDR